MTTTADGYGTAVQIYRDAGWRAPLPLPPAQKSPPPAGFTGYDGAWPSEHHFAQWIEDRPNDANLMLRVDYGVVGIDVDAYGDKTGDRTLNEAERAWGALPPTFRSSARSDDSVSGIRLFRKPEGTLLRGFIKFDELKLGDIDIVQTHHRCVVAWPSVHPTTSQRYRWYAPDGSLMPEGEVATVEELPNLPQAWVEFLSRDLVREEVFDGSAPNRTTSQRERINEELYQQLIGLHDDGPPDNVVSPRLDSALLDLTGGGGSRYESTRNHVVALMRMRAVRRVGVPRALEALRNAYVMEVTDTRPKVVAESEFLRSVQGAAVLVAASMPRHDPEDAEVGAEAHERAHLRNRLLTVGRLRTLPRVEALIDGLLYRDTLAQLSGHPGCYKSFSATAMACAIATGEPFAFHRVPKAGNVVYVAAEGANNLAARILAWCEVAGFDPDHLETSLQVLPLPIQLNSSMDVTEAVELVEEIDADLLILDTRARCTLGLDENSATEQGKAINAAERIRAAAGCTVLGVHHSARGGTAGRGSNSWDGAVWSDLRMTGQDLRATITCEKHKDVPSGCKHHFGLQRHTVSEELMPGTLGPERETLVFCGNTAGTESLSTNSQRVVLEILRKSAPLEGFTGTQVIQFADLQGVKKSAAYEALKVLVKEGRIENLGSKKGSRYVAVEGTR